MHGSRPLALACALAILVLGPGAFGADATYAFRGYSTTLIRGQALFGEMTEACRHDFGGKARLCSAAEWSASAAAAAPRAAAWIGPDAGDRIGNDQCRLAPARGLGLALFPDGRLVGISCDRFRPVTCCTPRVR